MSFVTDLLFSSSDKPFFRARQLAGNLGYAFADKTTTRHKEPELFMPEREENEIYFTASQVVASPV